MSANQNIELKDGQSLAGARYFDSSKPQTKLNFNFAGKIDNAIVVGNNTMISDLEINVTSDTCSNYTNAVLQGTAKVNLIYNNIDINMDLTPQPAKDTTPCAAETSK